jgi:hypothetical protein
VKSSGAYNERLALNIWTFFQAFFFTLDILTRFVLYGFLLKSSQTPGTNSAVRHAKSQRST